MRVNPEGEGYRWLAAALSPGCGGQSGLTRKYHYRAAPGSL